jgi:hypothetical protein
MIDKFLAGFVGVNPLYLAIAAAVIAAAGFGTGWTVNGWRLGAELEAKQTTIAKRDGRIRELELGLNVMGQQVETQNVAIEAWQAAAAARGREGDLARQAALEAAARLQPDLERLRTLIGSRRPDGQALDCAGAVAEIRKGLKP